MVVVAEKADVDIEVVDKVGEHVLTDPDGGRRVGPINWVATAVTTRSRLRARSYQTFVVSVIADESVDAASPGCVPMPGSIAEP